MEDTELIGKGAADVGGLLVEDGGDGGGVAFLESLEKCAGADWGDVAREGCGGVGGGMKDQH